MKIKDKLFNLKNKILFQMTIYGKQIKCFIESVKFLVEKAWKLSIIEKCETCNRALIQSHINCATTIR